MNSYFKIGIAFASGAIAGAIAGILLAPDKGETTREKLVERAKDFEANFKDITKNMKEMVKGKSEHVEETVFT